LEIVGVYTDSWPQEFTTLHDATLQKPYKKSTIVLQWLNAMEPQFKALKRVPIRQGGDCNVQASCAWFSDESTLKLGYYQRQYIKKKAALCLPNDASAVRDAGYPQHAIKDPQKL
jgi:hypothetical protein